jgi:enterochelin esterase family protein
LRDAVAVESPRLQALTDDGLEAFWAEVARSGSPLVEPIPADDSHVLLTFLWRATSPVRTVAVYGGPAGFGRGELRRLGSTDVWHRTYRVRKDLRTMYRLAVDDPPDNPEPFLERSARWIPDPLNPARLVVPAPRADSHEYRFSVVELPDAPPQPWIVPGSAPAGTVSVEPFRSSILGNERRIWTYVPPCDLAPDEPRRLLVSFDGDVSPAVTPIATVLDNLQAAGRIPPTVALLVDALTPADRDRELPCHEPFVEFLAEELVPWARSRVSLSADPRHAIVSGQSYGGLAAAFAGLRRPDVFGNVLSQSGSFWWAPEGEEPEWLARQYAAEPIAPLRFWLEVGLLEDTPFARVGPSMLTSNRHLRTVLRAKGYADVTYGEFNGGHDYVCWRGSLADGLIASSS